MGDSERQAAYERILGYAGPCGENLFAPGGTCDTLYHRAYLARIRLAGRLNTEFDDADLEELWRALLDIQSAVAARMYDCGRARERWGVGPAPPQ